MKTLISFRFCGIYIGIVLLILACKEPEVQPLEQYYSVIKAESDPGFPEQIEQDSLIYTSVVTKLGTGGVKKFGICYGPNKNPTVSESVIYANATIDTIPYTFKTKVKNIQSGIFYQVRSFVMTAKDTVYGPNNYFRAAGFNEWHKRVVMPSPLLSSADASQFTTFFDDKRLFLMFHNEARLFEYDIRRYTWVQQKLQPTNLKTKTLRYSFMLNGKGYVGNVQEIDGKISDEFWEYDTKTDTWRDLGASKPKVESSTCQSFSDGRYGYLLSPTGTGAFAWNLWRFDPATNAWVLLGRRLDNELITNVFADGTNTFVVNSKARIYRYSNQNFDFFYDASALVKNLSGGGFYGGVLKGKLIIGDYSSVLQSSVTRYVTNALRSIDINSKATDELLDNKYGRHTGTFQTSSKLFFGLPDPVVANAPYMSEYFPK